jgi:hypothetical protein
MAVRPGTCQLGFGVCGRFELLESRKSRLGLWIAQALTAKAKGSGKQWE